MSGNHQEIDWSKIRSQVESARLMTEAGWKRSAEEKKRILLERARALAKPISQPAAVEDVLMTVLFRLAGESYAVEFPFVREVYPLREFTPLPSTPPFVLGIVNVRGQILSIVDLRYFFELPRARLSETNSLIILRYGEMEYGILADEILGVQSLARNELQQDVPTLTGIRETYLKGVTRDRIVLLDGGKILSDKSLIVQEQV
jgi:purine-binding chemotaxis protein CheW